MTENHDFTKRAMVRGLHRLVVRLAEAEAGDNVTTNIHDLLVTDEDLVGFADDDDLLCELDDLYERTRRRWSG